MIITSENELKKFASDKRVWQGIPSIEVTKGGRLFYTFYSGGIKEQFGNYCILKCSNTNFDCDKLLAVEYEGENKRSYDPCLWIDPLNRLWWIWSVMPSHSTYACICENPDANEIIFGKPFKIGYDVMLNKPTVLSTGEWLFPIAVWGSNIVALRDCPTPHRDKRAFVYKSVNNGETFTKFGGVSAKERSYDEHMIIEKMDGSLVMFIRARYGIAKSYSYNGGKDWTEPVNSWLGGPDSRFFIRRLKSGKLLLINHYNFSGRNNLTAMISDDDGENWYGHLTFDERDSVSYPDAVEADDGFIYIIYDRERGAFLHCLSDALKKPREVLCAKITEEDIASGKIVSKGSRTKVVLEKLSEYNGEVDPYKEIIKNKEEYVRILSENNDGNAIIDKLFEDYGRCCITFDDARRKLLDDNCAILSENSSNADILTKIVAIEKIISVLGEGIIDDAQYSSFIIERIKTIVNDNLSVAGFGLNELADELNISKFYMCHFFKARTGTTILQYMNYCRIAKAKKLLINTDKSILSISLAVGITDTTYFSKWFKKAERISPLSYRNLNKKG